MFHGGTKERNRSDSVHHFFTETEFFGENQAIITGPDVNHIRNVLRMRPGDRILLSDGKGTNCLCELCSIEPDRVTANILPDPVEDTELPVRITIYQGLPKADKMEFVVQKSVELGAFRIVPVDTSRTVVRLDKKKEAARRARWQGIAESAAKQSKRMIVPEISPVMKFEEAVAAAKQADLALIPYEDSEHLPGAGGMALTRTLIGGLAPGQTLAVFIGPEGGFSDEEIELALHAGIRPVTLGKRILRTETAALFVLSAAGLLLE
ncbi:MAG TPA: 16S rRNA (uracil(1498)-N(3))-methyltransferase [Candidatus Copromonas faecavium]|uniref:Ribosomal RNA small subunit methyltransferase E n=1 Tax=Candidatus Copromonas faecavium (nom. illeg.) TaxID=2840740 RepID=A0A9D1D5V0_9FIRM|nr:16S rRNA (uracil(1498)-N(3))-methyltransferase [Candidatus Copromonas faecavium]